MKEEERKKDTDQTYKCSNCGAPVKYQPGTTSVYCEYCKTYSSVSPQESEKKIAPNVVKTKAVCCHRCKAVYSAAQFPDEKNCVFCKEPVYHEDIHELFYLAPEALIPFGVDEAIFIEELKKWFGKNTTVPNPFKKSHKVSNMSISMVYMPCFVSDVKIPTDAEQLKNPRFQYKKAFVSAAGNFLTQDILKRLGPFDRLSLVPIQEEVLQNEIQFLFGYFSEPKQWIPQEVTQKFASIASGIRNLTLSMVLIPVYYCSYMYVKERYILFGNGVNGKMPQASSTIQKKSSNKTLKAFFIALGIFFLIIYFGAAIQYIAKNGIKSIKTENTELTKFIEDHTFKVIPSKQTNKPGVRTNDVLPVLSRRPIGELKKATGWLLHEGQWHSYPNRIAKNEYEYGIDKFNSCQLYQLRYDDRDYLLFYKDMAYWVLDKSAPEKFNEIKDKETTIVPLKVYVKGIKSIEEIPQDIIETAKKQEESTERYRTYDMLDFIIYADKHADKVLFLMDKSYYSRIGTNSNLHYKVNHKGEKELKEKYFETTYKEFSKLFKLP